jgi:hypothetical protein
VLSYLNFISLLRSLARLTKKNQQGYSMTNASFFPKSDAVWDKFFTRIRLATQTEKIIKMITFKYENIKFKKII